MAYTREDKFWELTEMGQVTENYKRVQRVRKLIRKYRKQGWESVALAIEEAIGDWEPGKPEA